MSRGGSRKVANLLGCVAVALLLVSTAGAAVAAKPAAQQPQPSKIAYIVQDRSAQVGRALQTEGVRGQLPLRTAQALSDNLLKVNARGEILVALHSARAVDPGQIKALEALGGRVTISTADLKVHIEVELLGRPTEFEHTRSKRAPAALFLLGGRPGQAG